MSQVVPVVTSDKVEMNLDKQVALQCKTIANLIGDTNFCEGNESISIPLSNVDSETLQLIVTFSEKHVGDPTGNDEDDDDDNNTFDHSKWDFEFINNLEKTQLFKVTCASDYLHHSRLLDLCVTRYEQVIFDKPVDEIYKEFGLQTPLQKLMQEEKAIQEDSTVDEKPQKESPDF